MFRSRVILENERGQYFSTAPLPFSPCASVTEANRSPQNPAVMFADCRMVFYFRARLMSRLVFFDFLFLGCRSECGWFRAVMVGFTCLFRSRVILENERGQYFSTAPLPFSPCASVTEANRSPQNPAVMFADCRMVFYFRARLMSRLVFFDFLFLGCRSVLVCLRIFSKGKLLPQVMSNFKYNYRSNGLHL